MGPSYVAGYRDIPVEHCMGQGLVQCEVSPILAYESVGTDAYFFNPWGIFRLLNFIFS